MKTIPVFISAGSTLMDTALPLCTPTRIYMTGSVRSWIHYIELRSANGTQKEHMDIANECKSLFIETFPTIAEALEWS